MLRNTIHIIFLMAALLLPLSPAQADHKPICKVCGASVATFMKDVMKNGPVAVKNYMMKTWTTPAFPPGLSQHQVRSAKLFTEADAKLERDMGGAHADLQAGDIVIVIDTVHEGGTSIIHSFLLRTQGERCIIVDHAIVKDL